MILYYQSSNGAVFDLKDGQILRTRTADFHTHAWSPQTVEQQYGSAVQRFDKEALTFTILFSLTGSLEKRREMLNQLHAAFEADIFNRTPGRITHGAFYIDGYVIASSTYPEAPFTQNEIQIYCPYPFWVRDHEFRFETIEDSAQQYEYLDYAYDYAYDFAAHLPGYGKIENPGEAPANYHIRIYGPATAPYVSVGNRTIGITADLGTREYLDIDSKNKTVTKYAENGVKVNLFNARIKGSQSIFDRIAAGDAAVLWNGTFEFDLTLYEERGEPLWI